MVEVTIDSIRVSLMSEHRVIVLKQVSAERYLPIWIGPYEADAIAIKLRSHTNARPLTHDLLNNAIAELGGEVSYIVVNDMRRDIYYANIVVNLDNRQISIDARPSDAIALAVRANATIFVEEEVMAKHGTSPEKDLIEDADSEDLEVFRNFVDSLDLDDLPIQ